MNNYTTVRFEELLPEDIVGMIGKPVFIGVYSKPDDENGEDEYLGDLAGVLEGITVESNGEHYLRVVGSGEPMVARYNSETYYALVTYLRNG